jgi:hypothetical protein
MLLLLFVQVARISAFFNPESFAEIPVLGSHRGAIASVSLTDGV